MLLRDFHLSGRFDATDDEAGIMFAAVTLAGSMGAITEGMKLHAPEGWDSVGHESLVLWNTRVWELLDAGVVDIPTPPWKRGSSPRTSVPITWAVLRNRHTGRIVLRLAGHLPAHLWRPSQRKANLAALKGLRPLILGLVAKHKPHRIGASFDFNRDLRLSGNRKLIEGQLEGTGLHLLVPPRATHDVRKIDGYLTDCVLAEALMLSRFKGFDHRGFRVRACL